MSETAQKLDIKKIRSYFPIFQNPDNENIIYLDSAATTHKPKQVLDAMNNFYERFNANTHRGAYRYAEKATKAFEDARSKAAVFIGADSSDQIVFTHSATEAINFVARGWAEKFLKPGDEILVTEMEHHSNLVPWQMVAMKTSATLKYVEFDADGNLPMDRLGSLFSEKTKILAVTHASNALGTINPVEEIIKIAHQHGALVMLDAAQSVPHISIDVKALDVDFMAFSGHKMLGPMGIGVLYAKRPLLQQMDPVHFGGDMISDVDYFRSSWNDLPWKFEAGTQNVAGAIGLGAAIDFIKNIGMKSIQEHDKDITDYAIDRFSAVKGITIFGPKKNRNPVLSFNLQGVHAHDLATFLDQKNIAIRSGHHCAQLVMKKFGVSAMARASFYIYNGMDDVNKLIERLIQARDYFVKWQ